MAASFSQATEENSDAQALRTINERILAREFSTVLAKADFTGLKASNADLFETASGGIQCRMKIGREGSYSISENRATMREWAEFMEKPAVKDILAATESKLDLFSLTLVFEAASVKALESKFRQLEDAVDARPKVPVPDVW